MAAAARHLEHALALEPTDPDTIGAASGLAQSLGRLDRALELDEYAVARDPLNPARHGSLGYDFTRMGRLDDAIASYRTALSLSPGRVGTQYNIGEALLRKGDAAAALGAMQQEADENWRLMGVTMAQYALGKKAESDATLAELISKYEKDSAYNIAYVMAYRGESDRAFEWLDKAVAYHDTGLVEIADDPMFANIRRRSALAAVPAQDRQGAGAAGEDRVQGDAAARCGCAIRGCADDPLIRARVSSSQASRYVLPR